MYKINKILISLIISLWWFLSFSFADNSDCWIFAIWNFNNNWDSNSFSIVTTVRWNDDYIYSKFLTSEQRTQIIDANSLNAAILNLKKYCCENELWWLSHSSNTCKNDSWFFNPNSLDSPYLFDHLLDVLMRRLNWLTWDNNIYPNMEVDELWAERRQRIDGKAENLSGSDVQSIADKYQEFRTYHPEYDITSQMNAQFWDEKNANFLTYIIWEWWSESEKIANVFKNYENRSLYDRYNNACSITQYLYSLLNIWIISDDKETTARKTAKWLCSKITKSQIDNETKYVTLVAKESANRFLNNYIEGYLWYLYNRRITLENIRKSSSNKFLDVVKAVPHLVKRCVH